MLRHSGFHIEKFSYLILRKGEKAKVTGKLQFQSASNSCLHVCYIWNHCREKGPDAYYKHFYYKQGLH